MIEPLILAHLIRDDDYTRAVLPFFKKEYFTTPTHQLIFTIVFEFIERYHTPPSFDAVRHAIDKASLNGEKYTDAVKLLDHLATIDRVDSARRQWLVDESEKFIKERAVYLAISDGIALIEKGTADALPELLKEALAVGFHTHVGHDYVEDVSVRYDLLHQQHTRIPFDIDLLNKITNGGLVPKTLNVIVAGTNVGKSLALCHMAAHTLCLGKNVLYITLEMAEERIAQRIDANLLDVSMDMLEDMSRKHYEQAFADLKKRHALGKLIIKEYPTAGGHVGHFRALLNELALKKKFVPDLLIIDYINICSSVRFKMGGQTNSYTYVKSIAEELRGLAVETNVPLLTATQFNREGFDNSDPSLTNTSESFGLPQTADLQIALVTSEELEREGLLMVKQLKNRYADTSKYRRFTITVDRAKMRIGNCTTQDFLSEPMPPPPPKDARLVKPGGAMGSALGKSRMGNGPDIQFN